MNYPICLELEPQPVSNSRQSCRTFFRESFILPEASKNPKGFFWQCLGMLRQAVTEAGLKALKRVHQALSLEPSSGSVLKAWEADLGLSEMPWVMPSPRGFREGLGPGEPHEYQKGPTKRVPKGGVSHNPSLGRIGFDFGWAKAPSEIPRAHVPSGSSLVSLGNASGHLPREQHCQHAVLSQMRSL